MSDQNEERGACHRIAALPYPVCCAVRRPPRPGISVLLAGRGRRNPSEFPCSGLGYHPPSFTDLKQGNRPMPGEFHNFILSGKGRPCDRLQVPVQVLIDLIEQPVPDKQIDAEGKDENDGRQGAGMPERQADANAVGSQAHGLGACRTCA